MGGNKLIFDDLAFDNYANNWLRLVEKGTTTTRNLNINELLLNTTVRYGANTAVIQANKNLASSIYFQMWNGALFNIVRFASGATPFVDFLGTDIRMANLPGADPANGNSELWSNGGVVTVGT